MPATIKALPCKKTTLNLNGAAAIVEFCLHEPPKKEMQNAQLHYMRGVVLKEASATACQQVARLQPYSPGKPREEPRGGRLCAALLHSALRLKISEHHEPLRPAKERGGGCLGQQGVLHST